MEISIWQLFSIQNKYTHVAEFVLHKPLGVQFSTRNTTKYFFPKLCLDFFHRTLLSGFHVRQDENKQLG